MAKKVTGKKKEVGVKGSNKLIWDVLQESISNSFKGQLVEEFVSNILEDSTKDVSEGLVQVVNDLIANDKDVKVAMKKQLLKQIENYGK